MKVLQINTVYGWGSTGKITKGLHDVCVERGIECKSAHRFVESRKYEDTITVSSWLDTHVHNRIAKYTFGGGRFSYFYTKAFLRKVKKYNPDLIHLHNLHDNYINIGLLFKFIKKNNIRVVWTLHDCWAFTGGCPHFTLAKCDKWRNGCENCPQYNVYIQKYADIVRHMWKFKKECFGGVKNLEIVTPSKWLAGLVRESFLSEYNLNVVYNGIDTSVFRPVESDFRKKYNCEDKYIVLGVSFYWNNPKGLDVFIRLAGSLGDKYKVVLVGTSDDIDDMLPDNVLSIHRTESQKALAEIYTASNVFVNPTREEVLGLVNIEANACGTPVVTFNTGGSPECINEKSGIVVPCDDYDAMEAAIKDVCENRRFNSADCIENATGFDMKKKYTEYIDIYMKK